jgi:hypothetical protein
MRTPVHARHLLLLGLAGLVAGGCGGGSGASRATTSAARPAAGSGPAAQLIARADPMCARLNEQIARTGAKRASAREIERVVPQHVALERASVTALERMAAPPALAGRWRQILAYRRKLAAELALLLAAARRNDTAAIKALAASKLAVHKRLAKLAAQTGFKSCGQVG